MSEVDDLIKRYGPSFCVLPWKHINILDTGTCKYCCATSELRDKDNQCLTVYTSKLADIWNSEAMRDVRRAMIAGEPVPDCARSCIAIESLGGLSRRLSQNKLWETGWEAKDGLSIEDLRADAVRNNFYVEYDPLHIGLIVDNKCNLACRMCSVDRSSRVEKDPIHSRWAKRLEYLPRWEDNTMALGPNHLIFATYKGFHAVDALQKVETLWTTEQAEICLPGLNEYLETLEIRLSPESIGKRLNISVNGAVVYSNKADRSFSQNVTVSLNAHFDDLSLLFESETGHSVYFKSPVGVGLEHVAIKRNKITRPSTQLLFSRFPDKKHWMEENDFLFREVFPKGVQQKALTIVGGEPLINKKVSRIIKHLAKNEDPKGQRINFATNGTVFNKDIFKLAKKFKIMAVTMSIDATGKSHEYIRHGVKWHIVEDNLKRMMSVENVAIIVNCTIQAYNVLEITDVLHLCDQLNLRFFSYIMDSPRHLSIEVLPPLVREEAAKRVRAYIDGHKDIASHNKNAALTLINALELKTRPFDPQELQRFMVFTNDLDSSRGQNIKHTFPELVRLLEKAGYPWRDERFYFPVEKDHMGFLCFQP